jgi:hypothetical protein
MPPLVPATVNAKVPDVVIGEPATEIMPPVKVWATDVTPVAAALAQDGTPPARVKTCPFVPADKNVVVDVALW